MEITIRPYTSETDDSYIYSTWTKYSWYSPIEPIDLPKNVYFIKKAEQIKYFLESGLTKVACLKDEPYVIIGYVVAHNNEIKWLCVKKDFRNQGIEEFLLKSVKGKEDGRKEERVTPVPEEST